MNVNQKAIHISLSLTLNEDPSWSYRSPKVETNVQFSIPVEMLTSKLFGDYIEKAVKQLESGWDKAVKEHEAEVAAEEAKKAKAEVEV